MMRFENLKRLKRSTSHLLTLKEQKQLEKKGKNNPIYKDFMVGKTVLYNLPRKGFHKETEPKRAETVLIDSIDYR